MWQRVTSFQWLTSCFILEKIKSWKAETLLPGEEIARNKLFFKPKFTTFLPDEIKTRCLQPKPRVRVGEAVAGRGTARLLLEFVFGRRVPHHARVNPPPGPAQPAAASLRGSCHIGSCHNINVSFSPCAGVVKRFAARNPKPWQVSSGSFLKRKGPAVSMCGLLPHPCRLLLHP